MSSKQYHAHAMRHPQTHYFNLTRWWTMVEEYTRLALSNPDDRLPALSGLAQQWQQKRGGDYLAGLWRSSMIKDLQWLVSEPTKRPTRRRAPSWSWASVDGGVQYESNNVDEFQDTSTLVEIKGISKGPRFFGEVQGVQLTISGPLVKAKLLTLDYAMKKNDRYAVRKMPDSTATETELDESLVDSILRADRIHELPTHNILFSDYEPLDPPTSVDPWHPPDEIYCLLLRREEFVLRMPRVANSPITEPLNQRYTQSIVLRRVGLDAKTYERIGFMKESLSGSSIDQGFFTGVTDMTTVTIV